MQMYPGLYMRAMLSHALIYMCTHTRSHMRKDFLDGVSSSFPETHLNSSDTQHLGLCAAHELPNNDHSRLMTHHS